MEKHILSIGYAKKTFENGSREQERMIRYATLLKEFHLIVFTRKREGFEYKNIGNLHLYPTNSSSKFGMLWDAYKIGKKIKETNKRVCWIVSSQDPFETSLVGRMLVRGGRSVHHVQMHGDLFNPNSYSRFSALHALRMVYGKYAIKKASAIRVVSNRIKRSLIQLGVVSDISVIPIQSDMSDFIEAGKRREYADSTNVKFLYVGRFSPEKNISMLLDAFAAAYKVNKEITLTLLGSGPLEDKIKKQIKKLNLNDRITIMPWSNNPAEVMIEHDVFCLASNHEGWAMVLLEASATGMPVITTDVGCVGEVIFDNKNALVVPVGDGSKYADAISRLASDSYFRKKLGENSRNLATEAFISEEEFTSRVVAAYPNCDT